MTVSDLLFEIGTEELPPTQLKRLSTTLGANIEQGIKKAGLAYGEVKLFATPRRLAVYIQSLETAQKSHIIEKRGPTLTAAFSADGHPTLACIGFAHACGTTVEELTIQETEKGSWLFFRREQEGERAATLLPDIIRQALLDLPIAKPMRWGAHETYFIRPVHWAVLLLGEELIETDILGQRTTQHTYGHRFHHPGPLSIPHPNAYESLLKEQGWVIADYDTRKETIREQIEKLTGPKNHVWMDEHLLDEVTSLVEWPNTLLGTFEASFLEIPPEVLVTVMKIHQKYFSVLDSHDQLLPFFLVVANIKSEDPTRVTLGNQRVLKARLTDAQFFYHSDLKHTLESQLQGLKSVLFHKKLGSLFEKSERIAALALYLATELNADPKHAHRAGLLSKADLMSTMVSEFPELQGIMGYYYGLSDKEPEAIAIAIREHYQPRFSGDELPATLLGCIISIADKIDTLLGLFAVHQPPSGEKDPFALRRAALGVLRIITEKQLNLDLLAVLKEAAKHYSLETNEAVFQTFDFIMERARAWNLDRHVMPEVFSAVLARKPTQPLDLYYRIEAVQYFQALPEAKALTAAYKRVSRILKDQHGEWRHQPVDPSLLQQKAEQQLATAMEQKNKKVEPLIRQKKYLAALTMLVDLQSPIDTFFDEVMVMVDEEKLRNNRLCLLNQLQQLYLQVADLSLLPG